MLGFGKNFGSYTVNGQTATAGTAITVPLPPYMGEGTPPPLCRYDAGSKKAGWAVGTGAALSRLASLQYLVGADAHTLTILRPLNFTYFTATVAAGTTTLPVAADPGIYSTNYLYNLPGGNSYATGPSGPSQVVDRAAAVGDYVMYQLLDGTWFVDTIASGGGFSGGTITVTSGPPTPTVAGNGGCYANGPLFLMGVAGVVDPATGLKQPSFTTGTSATTQWIGNSYAGGLTTLHPGDPLLVISNNVTAAGIFEDVTIAYGRH